MRRSISCLGALGALVAAVFGCSAARADIAVIVHPDAAVDHMTAEQIAAVYLGIDESWRPIDLPKAGRLRNWFYYRVTGHDEVQVNVAWAKRIARIPPTLAQGSADAIRRVGANRRAIAYVDARSVDSSVKVVMTVPTSAALDRLRDRGPS